MMENTLGVREPHLNNVVLITPHHVITGGVALNNLRLSDFLNDKNMALIGMRHTAIARLSAPGKIIERHPLAVIAKPWVVLAFEPEVAAPAAKRFYSYVKKQTREVYLAMDALEVRGILHTPDVRGIAHTQTELDMRRLAATLTGDFLPLTKAVVTLYTDHPFVIEQNAVMVNVSRIRYIGQLESKPPVETRPTPSDAQAVRN